MSRKDASIGKIIDNAIEVIPKRDTDVYDPQEGLKDAIRTLKAIYEARLSDYVDSKQESVAFCYDLAQYLQGIYPRQQKKEKKRRTVTRSPEAIKKSTDNLYRLWSPYGNRWEAMTEEWKAENIKNFDKGGKWEARLELPEIKAAVEKYKAENKTSSRKSPAKK